MHFRSLILTILALTFAASHLGCSSGTTESNSNDTQTAKKASSSKKSSSSKLGSTAPCEVLTQAMVTSVFQVDASILTQEPYGKSMCTYRWEKPDADAIESRNQEIMKTYLQENMKAVQEGKTLERPKLEDSSAQVTLTLKDMDSVERASKAFDGMIAAATKGVTAEHDGVKATFRVIYDQQIGDIGDQAAWSSKSNQLSLRHGSVFLHVLVDVNAESDKNLADAKAIAAKIIAAH